MQAHSTFDDQTAKVIREAGAAAQAGRIREACEIGARGLADGCDPAALHAMIGSFLCWSRKFDASIPHLQAANRERPADPVVARNLATALVGCVRYSDALAVLTEDLVAADPRCDLQRLRGYAAQMAGDLAVAIEAYEHVVAIAPHDWETWHNLGNAKVSTDDLTGGIAAFRRAAELNRLAAPARLSLSRALHLAGDLAEAETQLRLMIDDFPQEVEALIDLAELLRTGYGDNMGARQALERAVERDPRNANLLAGLGQQQLLALEIDRAEASFRRALDVDPENSSAFLGLADALERYRPEDLYELAVQAESASVDDASLAVIKASAALRARCHEAGLEALQGVPREFEPERRWRLEGQLLDGTGSYDSAFDAFSRMNAAHAADRSEPLRRAARLRDTLRKQHHLTTEAWRDSWLAPRTPAPRAPVFLLGFPRSGTTLLDTILMGHPHIQVMEELPVMARVEAELGGFNAFATLGEAGVSRGRRRYFEIASDHVELRQGSLLVDKSPLHLLRMPQIVRLFPNARFILALRHPADVILSCFMTSFRLNSSMANFLRLDTAAEFYDLTFSMWERSLALFPAEVHTVAYERLIQDPEEVLRPVVEALGLTWHHDMLDHQRTAGARGIITTASYAQVTEPIYGRAAGRWRNYRRHLEPILPILEPWAKRFGYDLDPIEFDQANNPPH
jgi:tetratricopeptide (TPR) repeat protein